MPLQNVSAIETLKNLHHKLLVEVVKVLTIHSISHVSSEHTSKMALLMQLILLVHEIKNHKLYVCCMINPPSNQQLVICRLM